MPFERDLVRQAIAHENDSIRQVMKKIDESGLKMALILDAEDKLAGVVTDGDIRRGILSGIELDTPITAVMNRTPVTASEEISKDEMFTLMMERLSRGESGMFFIPILDKNKRVRDIVFLSDIMALLADKLSETKGYFTKREFKHCGEGVIIYSKAQLIKPEVISLGDYVQIDDYAWILGGEGVEIGKYGHICSFVTISGGGKLIAGDYVGISAGCRIITGTETYESGARMTAAAPLNERDVLRSFVHLHDDVFLGSNAIVHPGVTIGEGAMIGSNSLVLKDVEPWTINVGIPCKPIKERPRIRKRD